jgi:hypothetical protein
MTVTIERLSAPEPSSFTDWTNLETVDPVSVSVAFLAPVLGAPGASRFDRIRCFDCMHVFTAGRGTQNSSATHSQDIGETLSNDSSAHRWTQKPIRGKGVG